MHLNGPNLIRLPMLSTKGNYLDGFWRWVNILSVGNYERAIESLVWPDTQSWSPEQLKARVTTFFGGDKPWFVVIPNERLVNVINEAMECDFGGEGRVGWFIAQIPLTTEPADPKNDEIPLMGLAVSFIVREYERSYVLEIEIFHA